MLAPDKATRNLLPYLVERPAEAILQDDEDGGPVEIGLILGVPVPSASGYTVDGAMPESGSGVQGSALPAPPTIVPQASSPYNSSSQGPPSVAHQATGFDIGRISGGASDTTLTGDAPSSSPHSASSASAHGSAAPARPDDERGNATSPHGDLDKDGVVSSKPVMGDDGHALTDAPAETPASVENPLELPDGDDLHIVQLAFVDQDVDVFLNGWMGDSKIRVFADNDADISQDVDIDLDIDGDQRMFLRLDQSMTIDQATEIDVDIYEELGILYVDLFLRNDVDLEQNTDLDLMMDGWQGDSQFLVNNDLDVRQNTDVDVDIEDELEEKFAIKVAIGIKQAISINQDADIEVSYADGGFGVDVEATQTAAIDQDTILKIDFAVI